MNIQTDNIQVSFGPKTILHDISLDIRNKEFVGIIGPNGSGKSTFLKCVYRVQKPTEGGIFLNGKSLDEMSYRESALQLAVVAQHNFCSFDFDVLQVVLMGRSPHKKILDRDNAEDYAIARHALETVGLAGFEKRSFSTLSILARALTQQTECMVLDEPTNHLDIKYQLQIMDIVKGLDLTVVAAVHDLNIAAMYCDRLIAVKDGMIVGCAAPEQLLTEKFIYELYGVRTKVNTSENGRINIIYLPQHWRKE